MATPRPPLATHEHSKRPHSAASKAVGAVTKSLRQAAAVVAKNADKGAFPGALLLMVFGFLTIQGRMDRNDPKLALAPVFAEPDLEFGPPPDEEGGAS